VNDLQLEYDKGMTQPESDAQCVVAGAAITRATNSARSNTMMKGESLIVIKNTCAFTTIEAFKAF
jgi:hypothetical protein